MYYLQRLTLLDVDHVSEQYKPIFELAAQWLDAGRKSLENKVLAGGIAEFSYQQALESGLSRETINSRSTFGITQDELRTISHFLKRYNGRKLPLEPIAGIEPPEINEAAIEYINQEETIAKLVNFFVAGSPTSEAEPSRNFQMSLARRYNPDQVRRWIQAHVEPIGKREWIEHLIKTKSFPDISESLKSLKAKAVEREKQKQQRKELRQRIKREAKNKPYKPFNIDEFLRSHAELVDRREESKLFKAFYSKDVVALAHKKIDELLPLENIEHTNVPKLHSANVDLKTQYVEAVLRVNTHLKKVYGLEIAQLPNADQTRILENSVFFIRSDRVQSSTKPKLNDLIIKVRQQSTAPEITRR